MRAKTVYVTTLSWSWGKKGKHIKQNSQEISGKSQDSPGRIAGQSRENVLRLTFPRAKLRRQIFTTGRNSGRRIGRNFLGIFVLHALCRTPHQNLSPNSSQFITPCLVTAPVAEISKFHLRELLGLGRPKGGGFLLTVGVFLLTVELLCLQSV